MRKRERNKEREIESVCMFVKERKNVSEKETGMKRRKKHMNRERERDTGDY